ncbi:MAG: hypothetical protein IPH56_09765 [Chitinophagaceae bacterium]|nr:hypothetical protein [Chitinophagaceae bacterium]
MPIPWQDEPSSFDPNNPCNVVDSLLKTTAFPVLLHKLRDSTINNYEIGYSQVNTLSPANYSETYFSGQNEVDALAVNVVLNNSSDGVAHNHYNSPDRLHNFSAEDIYKLAYYWSIGKINNLSTFSYTVVTDSTSYILMIDDPAAFISFAQSWFNSQAHFDFFKIHLYRNYHYGEQGNSIAEDEKTFLSALQAPPLNGAGLKLFRENKEMNSFTPIKVSSTGQLVTNPCN